MKKNPASIERTATASEEQSTSESANAAGIIFHSKPPANQKEENAMNAYYNERGQFRTPAEIAEIKKAAQRISRPWQTIAARPLYAAQVLADYRRVSRFDRKPFPVFGK